MKKKAILEFVSHSKEDLKSKITNLPFPEIQKNVKKLSEALKLFLPLNNRLKYEIASILDLSDIERGIIEHSKDTLKSKLNASKVYQNIVNSQDSTNLDISKALLRLSELPNKFNEESDQRKEILLEMIDKVWSEKNIYVLKWYWSLVEILIESKEDIDNYIDIILEFPEETDLASATKSNLIYDILNTLRKLHLLSRLDKKYEGVENKLRSYLEKDNLETNS